MLLHELPTRPSARLPQGSPHDCLMRAAVDGVFEERSGIVQSSRTHLLGALAMIAGGVAAFFVVLALMGIDPDERPLGLLGWVLGGVLIGPGFGYLVRWKKTQNDTSRTDVRRK